MTNTKKIIIFLTPLSNAANRKRRSKLISNCCLQNNFKISQIIDNRNSFHPTNLRKLIDEEIINTEIYAKSYEEIKLYEGITTKNDFLSIADFCLYYTLECNKN